MLHVTDMTGQKLFLPCNLSPTNVFPSLNPLEEMEHRAHSLHSNLTVLFLSYLSTPRITWKEWNSMALCKQFELYVKLIR